MASRKPSIDKHGEVRELSAEDMAKFKPAAEVLPSSLRKKLGVPGPQKSPTNGAIEVSMQSVSMSAQIAVPSTPTSSKP